MASSTGSAAGMIHLYDDVFPRVHARARAGRQGRRGAVLGYDGRAPKRIARMQERAVVDRRLEAAAVEEHAPPAHDRRSPVTPSHHMFQQGHRLASADVPHPHVDNLDRPLLVRVAIALAVSAMETRHEIPAGRYVELVSLSDITHVHGALADDYSPEPLQLVEVALEHWRIGRQHHGARI